jgi:TRAP-type C4-dicarboxylate transport system substrate-binding protein
VVVLAACSKGWLAKLPADLRAIVLEEAGKAEAPTNDFGAKDIVAAREVWTKNGGQIIALSPDDTAAFAKHVNGVAAGILREQAAAKEAFDKYLALAQKHKA